MLRSASTVLALGLVACAPRVRTTMIGQPQAPGSGASQILVFSTRIPECPFEEIALVSAAMGDFRKPGTDMDDLLVVLKKRAQQLGGHAVVGLTERPRTVRGRRLRFESGVTRSRF
jgi:hypothetical protein